MPSGENLRLCTEALGINGHWLLTGKGPMRVGEEGPMPNGKDCDDCAPRKLQRSGRILASAATLCQHLLCELADECPEDCPAKTVRL